MKETNEKKKNKKSAKLYIMDFLSFVLIMIVVFRAAGLVNLIGIDKADFVIKHEKVEEYPQAGEVYALYIDGENRCEVDWNEYAMLDENGNTDFKFCSIMNETAGLIYTILICTMLYLVIRIYCTSCGGNPFTATNIKLVKTISLLQLGVAFLPEVVRKTMSLIRFNYVHAVIEMERIYMLGIAVIICGIVFIFEKGLALKEDIDTIA